MRTETFLPAAHKSYPARLWHCTGSRRYYRPIWCGICWFCVTPVKSGATRRALSTPKPFHLLGRKNTGFHFPFSNRPRLAIPLSEKMDGNLRPVNQEIDGGQGGDEAVQIGVESSETSGITGIEDKSRGSAEPEKNERAVILRFPWIPFSGFSIFLLVMKWVEEIFVTWTEMGREEIFVIWIGQVVDVYGRWFRGSRRSLRRFVLKGLLGL